MKEIASCVLELHDLALMSLLSPRIVVRIEQAFRPVPHTDLEGHCPPKRLHRFCR